MHQRTERPGQFGRVTGLGFALAAMLGAGCGTPGGGDWYYHWNCHGDADCIALNPTGQSEGTTNEGPVEVNCTQLMEFARRFWGPAATNACDHSPTWGGGSGGGGGGLAGPPTITAAPASGAPGTEITIQGTNFPTTTSGVTVTIGGVAGVVTSATGTTLVVRVPDVRAGPVALVVTTALGTVTWSGTFTVTNRHQPFQLVVDSTSVYWSEAEAGGSVKKVGIGGGAVTTLASGLDMPQFLAQDATSLYWTEYAGGANNLGAVKKVAKGGGAVTTLAGGLTRPTAFAADADTVYWTGLLPTAVWKVAKAGGAVTMVGVDLGSAYALAVDGAGLYYFGGRTLAALTRGPLAGGVGTALSGSSDHGTVIVLDSASAYWGSSRLHSVPLAGGTTVDFPVPSVAPGPFTLGALAVDATGVYFVDGSSGAIFSTPVTSGAPTALASATGARSALAMDATDIYWTEASTPSIKKMPKAGGTVTTLASSPNVP